MAYVIDGNLYFQDGSKPPLQLTYSREDWQLVSFSDDGEKVFFFRGTSGQNLYSINIDETQEQVLVNNNILQALSTEYDESTTICDINLVPGTHRLLFRTCFYPDPNNPYVVGGNSDLLLIDTDTGEIGTLFPPGHVSDYYISPDGSKIAIDTSEKMGHIDIVSINGGIIRRNLVTYIHSEPIFLPPGVFWMPDSTGVTVLLPIPTFYESNDRPSYTVWHYMLDGGTGVQVSLDPLPMDVYMAGVSPDGNWIIYNDEQYAFYMGDLRTSQAELYHPEPFVFHYDWSPDSKHFIYRAARKLLYLGSVNSSPESIGKGEFKGWIDSSRFLYYADNNIVMGDIKGSKEIILADHDGSFQNNSSFIFILPKTQDR